MSMSWFRGATISAVCSCIVGMSSSALSDGSLALKEDVAQKVANCSTAYKELLRAFPNSQWENDALVRQHMDLFESYDKACQQGLDGLRYESTRDYLRVRLGAIFESESSTIPLCTAFRVTDRRVVTAEHCFWRAGKKRNDSQLRISFLAAPEERLGFTVLTEHPKSEGKIADETDVAVLELDEHNGLPLIETKNRFDLDVPTDVCGDAYILIPGVFRPSLVGRNHLDLGDWIDAIRMDGTQTCVRRSGAFNAQCILKEAYTTGAVESFYGQKSFKNKLCIVSNCQTYPGMSGSPIIGFNKHYNTLFAEGVYVRSGAKASNRYNTCSDLWGMNIGVSYPDAVVTILSGEEQ